MFGGGWVGGILIHQDPATRTAAIERALMPASTGSTRRPPTATASRSGRSAGCSRTSRTGLTCRPRCGSISSRLDDIVGQVKRSTEESLSRLRCDWSSFCSCTTRSARQTVDQLIGVDQVLGEDGVADALERMREQGLTRLIGITAIGDTAACRRVIASGRFDSAQVYYNILNPSAGQACRPPGRGATSAA